jgi:transketolase
MHDLEQLKAMACQVRRDILRMTHGAASGHPGGSLGCADLFTALYFSVMNHNAKKFEMNAEGEDVFFLSNGHISPAWYSVLARSGYFPVSELKTFRFIGTRLQGHPTPAEHLEGIRIASGSLGQGLSVSCGTAIAKKLNHDPGIVYCLMGDGELQEGQVWEAAMFAPHKKIDNLIAIVDYNGKQIDGPTDDVLSPGDLYAKWKSFGWEVMRMNGNEMPDIINTLNDARKRLHQKVPVVIIMKTEMGMGVDFMMGTHKWHGVAPNDEQLAKALLQIPETTGDY